MIVTWRWATLGLLAACQSISIQPVDSPPPGPDAPTHGTPADRPAPSVDAVRTTSRPPVSLGALKIDPARIPHIEAYDDVPVDTSSWRVQPYRGAKNERALKAAIDAAPPRTILQLPAGTYEGTLTIRRSEIVVRGDCRDIGAVVFAHRGQPQNTSFSNPVCAGGQKRGEFCGGDGDCPGSRCDRSEAGTICNPGWVQMCAGQHGDRLPDIVSAPIAWTGPFTRGTTQLKIADSRELAVSDHVWIASAPAPAPGERVDTDALEYIARVTAVGPGTITIDRGLPIDFGSTQTRIRKLRKLVRHTGVECLTVRHDDPANPDGLYTSINLLVRGAVDSWVRDVDLGDAFNTIAKVERSARVAILRTRFGEQHKSTRGDGRTCGGAVADNPCWNKQAIVFEQSHDCTFADNVVHASIGVELSHASSRNWIAYNWFPPPKLHPAGEARRALFPHGNYAYDNVFEGNVLWGVGEMDTHWGSQGPRYTWFRNVAIGPQSRFSTQAPEGAPGAWLCSRQANYLLNRATRFSADAGGPIDARSLDMVLERNLYADALQHGARTSKGTVLEGNAKGTKAPADWATLDLPSTLNAAIDDRPAFWCSDPAGKVCPFETTAGGVGALWDGRCALPAQVRAEGGSCP